MRILVLVGILFIGSLAARAEVPLKRALDILNEACVTPTDPSQIMKAAQAMAARDKWTVVASGPAPLPFQPRPGDPDLTDFAAWRVPLQNGDELKVRVQVVNPDLIAKSEPAAAGLIFSACAVLLPHEIEEAVVEAAIGVLLGAGVEKSDQKAPSGEVIWHFVDRKAQGDCSKALSSGGMRLPTIDFLDVVLPAEASGERRPWIPCPAPGKRP